MKYKYNIKNLDCANCAKTIENKLNEDKNIKKAIVNFNSSTVTVETDLKDVFTYIKKIVSEKSTEKVPKDSYKTHIALAFSSQSSLFLCYIWCNEKARLYINTNYYNFIYYSSYLFIWRKEFYC